MDEHDASEFINKLADYLTEQYIEIVLFSWHRNIEPKHWTDTRYSLVVWVRLGREEFKLLTDPGEAPWKPEEVGAEITEIVYNQDIKGRPVSKSGFADPLTARDLFT